MAKQEQITRKVTPIGNGAHVFAPKEWLGEEIKLIRTRKPLKERILSLLNPYLENIEGIYLYGSHARGEAEKGSDIDLLVVADKKLKIKTKGYEIIALKKEDIKKAIKISPILMHAILSEANPIINHQLLKELKSDNIPKNPDFKSYLKETKNIIGINKNLLEKKENLEGIAYSLILRLKGLFIIKSLLSNKKQANKDFEKWIKKNLPNINLKTTMDCYKAIKRNTKPKEFPETSDLKQLLNLLDKEIKKNGKKKKAS